MAIHVGELHTDVVSAEPPKSHGDSGAAARPSWEADRRFGEAAERAAYRRARVSADGFDD